MKTPKKQRKNPENSTPRRSVDTSSGEDLPSPTEETLSQQAEHFLVEFFATIEHEFRTPLAVIKGYASTLLRQGQQTLSVDQRESLQMIQDAEARLEVLTNHLLEIAQLEAGRLSLTYHPVDIPSLAHEVITHARGQLPKTLRDRFTFALHLRDREGNPTPDMPPVPGDLWSLRKVLEHLLENAMRFSPRGGSIDVVVGPAPLTAAPNAFQPRLHTQPFLELCVCDYGIGIPEEHRERIFEHFYRVDSSLTREVNGLGLGLSMCRSLVGLHHGYIWAESCPAGGSAFHVWLPLEHFPVIASREATT